MSKNLIITNILILSIGLFLPEASGRHEPCLPVPVFTQPSTFGPDDPGDTVKYQGYRLHLTDFKLLKKTDDWVKIRFTITNSGRKDIDLTREGTVHWVQINYDESLFEAKLGWLREHIRYSLAQEHFKLEAGKVIRNKELKVPSILLSPPKSEPEVFTEIAAKPEENIELDAKGGSEAPDLEDEFILKRKEECPDILFSSLKVIEQDDKWATLEYTILNQGKGLFRLYGMHHEQEENLVVRAYISGVATLSRGALPIGGQFIKENASKSSELNPGESLTGRVKLDVRKKTRYLKSLILSLDSNQFADECDKTNNTASVILD